MKRSLTNLSLFGSFIIYALTVNLFDTFTMFLLFGMIPGSSVVLTADEMLLILSAGVLIIILFSYRSLIKKSALQLVTNVRRFAPTLHRSA